MTNIGGVEITTDKKMKDRDSNDFYPTEQAMIDAYLDITNLEPLFEMYGNYNVADFGAGDGRWGKSIKDRYPNVILFGTDIRDLPKPDGFDYWFTGNDGDINNPYLFQKFPADLFSVIMGNPPYKKAEMWLDKCLSFVNTRYGMVSLLLSLNWLSGSRRYHKYYNNKFPLSRLTVMSTRPSFSENGKTYPGREYGQFEWRFDLHKPITMRDLVYEYGGTPVKFITYERKK